MMSLLIKEFSGFFLDVDVRLIQLYMIIITFYFEVMFLESLFMCIKTALFYLVLS